MSAVAPGILSLSHGTISANITGQSLGTGYIGDWPLEADELSAPFGADAGAPGPVALFAQAHSGAFATIGEEWYNRIHVLPGRLDLGNLLTEQVHTVEVWNAHFSDRTLDDILEVGTEGITVVKPFEEPAVYGPLQSELYEYTISREGPAAIAATYTFDFTSEMPVLIITGDRVIVFPFSAERPVLEDLEFLTTIYEAYDGSEQRVKARELARQSYRMSYKRPDPRETAEMLNTVFGNIGLAFGVPMWQDVRRLTADVVATGTAVPISTAHADFRDGGLAILWQSPSSFEVVEIDAVQPTQLDLVRPLQQNHDALDTYVTPLRICLAGDPVQHSRTPSGLTTLSATWRSLEDTDLSVGDGELTIYRGAPVLDDPNFMDERLGESIIGKVDVIDYDTGVIQSVRRRLAPELSTAKRWDTDDPEAAFDVRRLLYALRGRQRAFWLSTFREDFFLVATIGPTDTSIEVEPVKYPRFVDTQEPLGDIAIYLNDGSVFYREITASQELPGGNEQLDISSSLGQSVAPGDVLRISYLVRSRLNSDRVTITHRRPGSVVVTVPVAGVMR